MKLKFQSPNYQIQSESIIPSEVPKLLTNINTTPNSLLL